MQNESVGLSLVLVNVLAQRLGVTDEDGDEDEYEDGDKDEDEDEDRS